MKVQLPQKVDYIIHQLIKQGFEAYAVGGCVRDSILGRNPEDWDITTSAKPTEVKQIFRRTIDTGIVHGTVTVMLDKEGYEVTTYRIDGEYQDNRRPKTVEFTSNLVEDLKRRDFTINAMAYNEENGLVDVFGGLHDIKQGIIRCVGSALDRFDEDALRILRAVRFSAQLGFNIEKETLNAIKQKVLNLKNISAERIRVELNKLLLSKHPDKIIVAYEIGITRVVLPEFDIMMKTDQQNHNHIHSVGIHSIKAIQSLESKEKTQFHNIDLQLTNKERLILCWTMLLHDVEKPSCKTFDEDGEAHFYGHEEKGANTAKSILRRMKFDNETIDIVVRLIKWHDYRMTLTPAEMRRAMNKIGTDIMDLLFEVKKADILAQNPETWRDKVIHLNKAIELYQQVLTRNECVDIKTLKINGNDLIELGYKPGIIIGETLNQLLNEVIEDPALNCREELLERASKLLMERFA